ncbi:hypothetical protein P152DRAFT_388483 [Eremomyces bilateralis CBS 781.70]|uniref:Uncharacterized protein n=1 Tax=Eremomyces bilateralis CBS 781.70 TaxID=1392243 RepID=A0A6G1GD47_9PEZI|nr:uncharacterized protein P152DRAFT_388483 [Eremomyces bilateralis CBS 781.70]KAF1816025.1 hypothetical protein P152DRAFT_388483 [Eremomyces bilateralis CBS 781.70]
MLLDTSNCTDVPDTAPSDAGVAGAGVLLSFILTAALALILSAIVIIQEHLRKSEAKITRKLLLSFSDQQILTGIGIQCVAIVKLQWMIPYHFFLVWMLSAISTATHSVTLLALHNDFRRDWVLRWLRQALMFLNLVLSCALGIFVLFAVMKDLPETLPIACAFSDRPSKPPSRAPLSFAGTLAVIVGNCVVFAFAVWYLHLRGKKWLRVMQVISLMVLMAIGIGAAAKVIMLSQAFGTPSVALADEGEKVWSFGQLLPLLLLLLPFMSAVEIFRGEMTVPSPMADDQVRLADDDEQAIPIKRTSFDPNPFWGKQPVSRFSN